MVRPNSRRIPLGPDSNVSFGFAVRGGKEYSTGFFVSRIEKGSEAEIKGLKCGDQIIRVNGYHVDDAIHKELIQFISTQDRLTLKVRGVGMIPIKEKTMDALTWHIVPRHILSSTLTALDEQFTYKDVRVVLKVAPKTKLGLGICKGPDWKPGIFVQFTKDFSVARDSGLRPGDQILSCNSIDFSDVLFSEAVAVMKSSSTLEMLVRTGVGLDLFPGESSGYNSSASSVTGDQSPCWADQNSKRLSIVREESMLGRSPRDNQVNLDRRKLFEANYSSCAISDGSNKTVIQLSENGTLINNTIIPNSNDSNNSNNNSNATNNNNNNNNINNNNNNNSNNNNNFNNNVNKADNLIVRSNSNHLSSTNFATPDYVYASPLNKNNDVSNNNNFKMNGKIADICFVSRQSETKTVIVEVHAATDEKNNDNKATTNNTIASSVALKRSSAVNNSSNIMNNIINNNSNNINNSNIPMPPPPKPPLISSSSISSCGSTLSSMTMSSVTDSGHVRSPSVTSSIISSSNTSLSSAISEELKKRRERISQNTNQINNNCEANITAVSKIQPKRFGDERHNAISEELEAKLKLRRKKMEFKERQEELSKTVIMKDETDHRSPPPQQKQSPQINENIDEPMRSFFNHNGHVNGCKRVEAMSDRLINGQFPTPPPPPEFANNPPLSNGFSQTNREIESYAMPPLPLTPIPDYDSTPNSTIIKAREVNGSYNGTIARVAASEVAKANGEIAELESIDSYQLLNPSTAVPKPPPAYFAAQNCGPPTMKKLQRPVSVTIGEYKQNGFQRKEPNKFDFIAKSTENMNTSPTPSPSTPTNGETVSHMLRSELELTLSRSNLKKRNEFEKFNGKTQGELHSNGYNGGMYNGIIQNDNKNENFHNGNQHTEIGLQNGFKPQTNGITNGNTNLKSPIPNGKAVLNKASNIEKLTNMLQNKQNNSENGNMIKNGPINNYNRVTINIPNNMEQKRLETLGNGILKNGSNRSSYGEKSISFGN